MEKNMVRVTKVLEQIEYQLPTMVNETEVLKICKEMGLTGKEFQKVCSELTGKKIKMVSSLDGSSYFQDFFETARQYRRITHEEAIEIAKQMEKAKQEKEEAEYARLRNELVKSYLTLVGRLGFVYWNRGIPMSDVLHELTISLLVSADNWVTEYKKGKLNFKQFATYSGYKHMYKVLPNYVSGLNVPSNLLPTQAKAVAVLKKHYMEKGYYPTLGEIANELGEKVEVVQQALEVFDKVEYIDDLPADVRDLLKDDRQEETFEAILRTVGVEKILERILTPAEFDVLVMRYGLNGRVEELTQIQISKKLGLSVNRVSQLERNAIYKAQRAARVPAVLENLFAKANKEKTIRKGVTGL